MWLAVQDGAPVSHPVIAGLLCVLRSLLFTGLLALAEHRLLPIWEDARTPTADKTRPAVIAIHGSAQQRPEQRCGCALSMLGPKLFRLVGASGSLHPAFGLQYPPGIRPTMGVIK